MEHYLIYHQCIEFRRVHHALQKSLIDSDLFGFEVSFVAGQVVDCFLYATSSSAHVKGKKVSSKVYLKKSNLFDIKKYIACIQSFTRT